VPDPWRYGPSSRRRRRVVAAADRFEVGRKVVTT
jgi:hypothetical protein